MMKTKMIIAGVAVAALLVAPMQAFAGFLERFGPGEIFRLMDISSAESTSNGPRGFSLQVDASKFGTPTGFLSVLAVDDVPNRTKHIVARSMKVSSADYITTNGDVSKYTLNFIEARGSAHTAFIGEFAEAQHQPLKLNVVILIDTEEDTKGEILGVIFQAVQLPFVQHPFGSATNMFFTSEQLDENSFIMVLDPPLP